MSEGEGSVAAWLDGAPNAVIPVTTVGHDDDFLSLSVGGDFDVSDRVAISARYRQDFDRDDDSAQSLSLALSWRF